jgi:magnesium transporter
MRLPPWQAADELARADTDHAVAMLRTLDPAGWPAVIGELQPGDQRRLLRELTEPELTAAVAGLQPDELARLVGSASPRFGARVMAVLSDEVAAQTQLVLDQDVGSVGRDMTPRMLRVPREASVAQALALLRRDNATLDPLNTFPVVDRDGLLVGVVPLLDLVLAEPGSPVDALVDRDWPRVRVDVPAEAAARLLQDANVPALPVVDGRGRVLGLLTADDAMERLEQATSEDIARQSGVEPIDGNYLAAGVRSIVRARVPWLLLLLVAAVLTVNVMAVFEDALQEVVELALFIPLLVGTGGNAGAQAATSTVRALALGDVRPTDALQVAWRECRVGLLAGCVLAVCAFVIAWLFVQRDVAIAVGASVVGIAVFACVVGALVPLGAKRLGIDPAVVCAPLVTTVVDATGLLIYFGVATLIVL